MENEDIDNPPGQAILPTPDERKDVSVQVHKTIQDHLFEGQTRLLIQIGARAGIMLLPRPEQIMDFVWLRYKGERDAAGNVIVSMRVLMPIVFEPETCNETDEYYFDDMQMVNPDSDPE